MRYGQQDGGFLMGDLIPLIDETGGEVTAGREVMLLESIYVSLTAYLEGVNPHPIEAIIDAIVNEIGNANVFRGHT